MSRPRARKFYENCPAPGCLKPGDFARNFCSHHYLEFRKECVRNGSWHRGEILPSPIIIPHFVWEGSEDELAAMVEEQERLREQKEQAK